MGHGSAARDLNWLIGWKPMPLLGAPIHFCCSGGSDCRTIVIERLCHGRRRLHDAVFPTLSVAVIGVICVIRGSSCNWIFDGLGKLLSLS
jgi:hypothetical protein